jgi:hypothetical protein
MWRLSIILMIMFKMPIDELLDKLPEGEVIESTIEKESEKQYDQGFFIGILNYNLENNLIVDMDERSIVKVIPIQYLQKTGQDFIKYMLEGKNSISDNIDMQRSEIENILDVLDEIDFYYVKKNIDYHRTSETDDFDKATKIENYVDERTIENSDATVFVVEIGVKEE